MDEETTNKKVLLTLSSQEYGLTVEDLIQRYGLKREDIIVEVSRDKTEN